MTSRRAVILLALAATVSLPAGAQAHQRATPVTTCGTTITTPGTYYLKNDLVCPTTFGVDIESSKVLFLLAGHTIDNDGGPFAAVLVGQEDEGYSHVGVWGPGTVKGSANCSICVGNTSHVLVAGVTARENRVGFATAGSNPGEDVYFALNSAKENDLGFQLITGEDNTLAYNNCSDNNLGIVVEATSTGNEITRNACRDNDVNGIQLNSSGNEVTRNKATGNGGFDLWDSQLGCMGNTWADNVFDTANQSCIH